MYKLFYQLDRQSKEEEKQPDNMDGCCGLLSEKYRRDSFSTLSTKETDIVIAKAALPPVTWGEGHLPLEIAVPDTSNTKTKVIVSQNIASLAQQPPSDLLMLPKPLPNPLLIDDSEGTNSVVQTGLTSLLVDDDEDLNLIFTDGSHQHSGNQHDEEIENLMVEDDDSSESTSVYKTDDDSTTIHPPLLTPVYTRCSSNGTMDSTATPDGFVRFELKGFTRFEI